MPTPIKFLVVFVVSVVIFCPRPCHADAPQFSKIYVRDTDKHSDTEIAVINGQTIDPAATPAHWTLDFIYADAIHTPPVFFVTDGGAQQEFQSRPYCPMGHDTPLAWTAGKHTVSARVNSGGPLVYTFTIATPAAHPTAGIAPTFGSNGEGLTYASGDPDKHPAILTTMHALNFQYMRLWQDWAWGTPAPKLNIPMAYAKSGIKVIGVLNFQQSPKNAPPADGVLMATINSLPTAADSGIWGWCFGNETNNVGTGNGNYYSGSVGTMIHMMSLAYPKLHQLGYVVIAPSQIGGEGLSKNLVAAGVLPYCDYLDRHCYEQTAAAVVSEVGEHETYCATVKKPAIFTELGIRGSASNLAAWSHQVGALFTALKLRSGTYLQFPLFWLPSSPDGLCQMAPLGKDSTTPNQPFAAALNAVFAHN